MGILDGLDWNNIFIAGGAVLANLAADRSNYNTSDIDIFIYGIHDDEEANNKLRHIHEVVTRNSRSRGDVIRTERAVTILNSYPYRHVQIILRFVVHPQLESLRANKQWNIAECTSHLQKFFWDSILTRVQLDMMAPMFGACHDLFVL